MNQYAITDAEEKELMESYERGEWKPVSKKEFEKTKKILEQAVKNTIRLRKNKAISIRISEKDLEGIRKKAAEQGMPYQTLITSVLHQYITGTLVSSKAYSKTTEQKDRGWGDKSLHSVAPQVSPYFQSLQAKYDVKDNFETLTNFISVD
jgi:predicted DNA binding CopG/RHH family protein